MDLGMGWERGKGVMGLCYNSYRLQDETNIIRFFFGENIDRQLLRAPDGKPAARRQRRQRRWREKARLCIGSR